ncbi:MAG: hypothetical protein HOK61_03140 [Alphaproteobacteria bacterium]|nr:hypothetical protein [Alphaproteobacteria bacterium]MBT6961147.1 hypothetical protein [Rhodospirillaceae bacterium]
MKNVVFLLGLGTLVTHELDAMSNSEWLVLPIFRSLPEDVAVTVFVLGHIPLVAVIVGFVTSSKERTRNITKVTVSGFLVLHGIAHWFTSDDPSYQFTSSLSSALIYGGALLGAIHLLLSYRDSRLANAS